VELEVEVVMMDDGVMGWDDGDNYVFVYVLVDEFTSSLGMVIRTSTLADEVIEVSLLHLYQVQCCLLPTSLPVLDLFVSNGV
jgi:hypothetical protein